MIGIAYTILLALTAYVLIQDESEMNDLMLVILIPVSLVVTMFIDILCDLEDEINDYRKLN